MIISPRRRYVFVHIPKTGGTSLALALEGRAMKDDILIGDTPKARRRKGRLAGLTPRGRLWKHATLADIDGVLSRADLDAMLVFTLVRNPWDRLVSYYHWLRAQTFDHGAVDLAGTLGFGDFLRHPGTVLALRNAPYGTYLRRADGGTAPGLYLRLEHLETDLPPLESHLGFALRPLPRVNASERGRDYRDYYDAGLRDHVGALCAEDIARFDYRF